jgi:PGF-pre-PGF domain-containing protein
MAIGAVVQFAGIELFQPVFAEQFHATVADNYGMHTSSANSFYRSMSESLSVVASHGSGSNSPTSYQRTMSESMSITTIQGKTPNSYSRSMSEQASLTTGMPPSAPSGSQPRAASAPATLYSASSNQRNDERVTSTLKVPGKKGEMTAKNTLGGTSILATEFLSSVKSGSPDQFPETGESSEDASSDDSNNALLYQLDTFNEYTLMQKSLEKAALANLMASAVPLFGVAVVVMARQPVVSRGRLHKKMHAIFPIKFIFVRARTSQGIVDGSVTRVLLLILIIFTVLSIVNLIDPLAGQAFAAITYVDVGVVSTGSGDGDLTPALPNGLQTDDVMIVYYYTRGTGGSVSISAGWTPLYVNSDSSGGLAVWYRFYQNGDSAPTITSSGLVSTGNPNGRDDAIAQVAAWRGISTGDPIDALGTVSTNASQQNIGAISGITIAADSVVIVLGGKRDDWTSVATLSGDSLTWAEVGEPDSTAGGDAGIVWDYAINGAAQKAITTKTFTVTGGANAAGKGVMFSLRVPQNLQANPSDSLDLTDSITAAKTMSRSVLDSLSIVDTMTRSIVVPRAISEQMAVIEMISRSFTGSRSFPEQMIVEDTITRATVLSRSLSEQMSITESVAKQIGKSLIEQAAITENLQRSIAITINQSEQLAVNDSIAKTMSYTLTEQLMVQDTLVRVTTSLRTTVESLVLQETISKTVLIRIIDQVVMTEQITRNVIQSKSESEQLGVADTLDISFGKSVSESLIMNEAVARSTAVSRSMSEQMTVQDSVIKAVPVAMFEQLGLQDALARSMVLERAASEQLNLIDFISTSTSKSMLEQLSIQDTLTRSMTATISLSEQLTVNEIISKNESKSISEYLVLSEFTFTTATRSSSMSEQLVVTEFITSSVTKSAMEQLDLEESITVTVISLRTLSEQLNVTHVVEAQVSKTIAEQLSIQDTIGMLKAVSRSATESMLLTESIAVMQSKSTSDQLAVSDNIAVSVAISVSDQITISDSINVITSGPVFVTDQILITDSIAITVSKQLLDALILSDASMTSRSITMAESIAMADAVASSVTVTRGVSENLSFTDALSGSPSLLVVLIESMSVDESFADIALLIQLGLDEPLVLVQSFATDFAASFDQLDSEGIIIADNVGLTLTGPVNRNMTESMAIEDSLIMLVVIPPPSAPPAIAIMPEMMMTETEDLDSFDGLTEPMEAITINGTWNIPSLDILGLDWILLNTTMPTYDVDLEAASSGIENLTMILPTFQVWMENDWTDDGAFLTPTLSDLPAGMQVLIPINIKDSMSGVGNLDALGNMTLSFTAAESAGDFTMLIATLDNSPEDAEPLEDTPVFFIDISMAGNFAGTTPSNATFFEEPPQITFTVTEEWAQEHSVKRDSSNVPIIGLLLLDEGTGQWAQLSDEVEPPASAAAGVYTYTATLPHFSTYAVTVSSANTSGNTGHGGDRDSEFTRLLTESLFVSGMASLDVPAGSAGKVVTKDITESLTLRAIQLQPLYQRVITIHNVSVAVSVADVKPAAALGTAVVTLNFEIINKNTAGEELVLRYWYSDPSSGKILYQGQQAVTVGAGQSLVQRVEVPFYSEGSFDLMVEAESDDGTLATTDIAVSVPWLAVYLYVLVSIAIVVVLISIIYVAFAIRRAGLFSAANR